MRLLIDGIRIDASKYILDYIQMCFMVKVGTTFGPTYIWDDTVKLRCSFPDPLDTTEYPTSLKNAIRNSYRMGKYMTAIHITNDG